MVDLRHRASTQNDTKMIVIGRAEGPESPSVVLDANHIQGGRTPVSRSARSLGN